MKVDRLDSGWLDTNREVHQGYSDYGHQQNSGLSSWVSYSFYSFFPPCQCPNTYDSAANLSSSWINNGSRDIGVDSEDNSTLRPIFLGQGINASFACGFYCNYNCEGYLFAILIFPPPGKYNYLEVRNPKVVWSANQNFLVRDDATLQLTQDGDLILRDADGTFVWSSNTSGKSVVGLNLTEIGNLVLFDSNNASVWQSFDHPTHKSSSRDRFWFSIRNSQLVHPTKTGLKVLFNPLLGDFNCAYPMICGKYGVCSKQQCFCPRPTAGETRYFTPVNDEEPDLGLWRMVELAIYYLSEIFSLMKDARPQGGGHSLRCRISKSRGGSIFLKSRGSSIFLKSRGRYLILKGKDVKEDGEDKDLLQVPGMPTRFSHEILVAATENFSRELGKGGFGSVFEGILTDGTKVAVKCINGLSQTKDYFLAEVETIGGIHHLNLEEDHPGYSKGSILSPRRMQTENHPLRYQTQNILLDESFNAKVSDFGLSKLMDRDQSQVVTTLRGTPGYMAPEWLISAITEKVDVYSFGIVTLEILCGRRNLDHSQPEEDKYLLSLFKRKAEEDQMLDLVDKYSEDMQFTWRRSCGADEACCMVSTK
ncbi:G-type lectin S-receptor-like serine/threonine-protein kinase SD2-5 [Vitis vinifera]|uniref:G-type lectin S-receptor-like serine/threonine-protein kinase SD2-5 n=1 Tax=Vitis vinifera TaxID=29760 RepID=A0A438HMX7_VITVI|nr:G-type lectin S-receptor-like serine/threonine-protein kinase SD2-5 [Vitis vinifera]